MLHGGNGDDQLSGDNGVDAIFGDDDNDTLDGGNGDDALTGGFGNDSLTGGRGDDHLVGSFGTDSADGDQGFDVCAAESLTDCEEVIEDDEGVAPESIQLVTPQGGETVFASTLVTVSVTPTEAQGEVDVLVDGNLIGTATIDSGIATVAWDTTTSGDGSVVLAWIHRWTR